MVLTGETREMQENATPAKEPSYKGGEPQRCGPLSPFEVISWMKKL
nr:MAG TPA: hypothetical protein [Bacteriophage sp.]